MTTSQAGLAERIDRLERENRRQKRCLHGALVGAALLFLLGAAASDTGHAKFEDITSKRIAITDSSGAERLVLELDDGEPSLKMLNHDGQQQVRLGINESWSDSAYLELSSRLDNGAVDKQAILVATKTQTEGAAGFGQNSVPGSAQLLLYDVMPNQKTATNRQLMRLSSGRQELKPYLEIREVTQPTAIQVNHDLLTAEPYEMGPRFLLNTATKSATDLGVE